MEKVVAERRRIMDENSEQLRDEMTILGMHIQRFFVEDHRPWAEVRVA